MKFKITGIVREKESKKPIHNLMVRAFDKDLFFSDVLGNAVTDRDGLFAIGYEEKDFRELCKKKPDIYLVIYGSATAADPGVQNDGPIYTTKDTVRFNAGRLEHFVIEIPAAQLGKDAPGSGIVPPLEPGIWKEKIDDFFKEHPIGQTEPDKGFASPRLKCNSNFGPEIRNLNMGDSGLVTVTVTNYGNGPSFFAYVHIYEGPGGYTHPLRDYRLNDYKIVTIYPGQTRDVGVRFTRLLNTGRIVGVCFDPFLDPRGFTVVGQYNPHITSIHYSL